MRSKKVAATDPGRCVACGACMKVCPRAAIAVWKGCYAGVDRELCVGCGKCAAICPVGCIEVTQREERNE